MTIKLIAGADLLQESFELPQLKLLQAVMFILGGHFY
jgi:hypothetical protein